jgi:hypothetical protein
MRYTDQLQQPHEAKLRLYVMPLASKDVILGLPDICRYYGALYQEMVASAIAHFRLSNDVHAMELTNTRYPWTLPLDECAPEELLVPEPCSFTGPIHFMNISHNDACIELKAMIDTQVDPTFLAHPGMRELIETKLMQVCTPTTWAGIKGTPPLEFDWTADFPAYHKPAPRNINPRLYEEAFGEFKRMLGYFYEEYNSPVASALVVAKKATKPHIRLCGDYPYVNKFIHKGHFPIPHVRSTLEKIAGYKIHGP